MTTPAQQVLANAAKRIGYYALTDPKPGSEAGRYWTAKGKGAWLSGQSTRIWWCMLFVSMVFDEAGQIDAIGGFSYNTDVTINHCKAKGINFVSIADAKPGDVVIFNWNGGGTDHVGVVEKNLGRGALQTIEGNTSNGVAGSQYAGNGVWRRIRRSGIACVIRPAWRTGSVTASTPTATVNNASSTTTAKPAARRDIRPLQRVLHTTADNISGPNTRASLTAVYAASNYGGVKFPYGVKFAQKVVGTVPDGIWGDNSKRAHDKTVEGIQRLVGAKVDGIYGPETDEKAKAYLSQGRQS